MPPWLFSLVLLLTSKIARRQQTSQLILLRTHHGMRPGGLAFPSLGPIEQLIERRAELLLGRCQSVLTRPWANHGMNKAADDPVSLQAAHPLNQYLLRGSGNSAL